MILKLLHNIFTLVLDDLSANNVLASSHLAPRGQVPILYEALLADELLVGFTVKVQTLGSMIETISFVISSKFLFFDISFEAFDDTVVDREGLVYRFPVGHRVLYLIQRTFQDTLIILHISPTNANFWYLDHFLKTLTAEGMTAWNQNWFSRVFKFRHFFIVFK